MALKEIKSYTPGLEIKLTKYINKDTIKGMNNVILKASDEDKVCIEGNILSKYI